MTLDPLKEEKNEGLGLFRMKFTVVYGFYKCMFDDVIQFMLIYAENNDFVVLFRCFED